jgi:predicted acetyltransferase
MWSIRREGHIQSLSPGGPGTDGRVSKPYPIRAIQPDEFAAFCAVPEQAFNSSWPPEPSREHVRTTFEFDRSAAALDADQIAGTACTCTFRLSVPGGTVDAAGVSAVAVLPTYRRRGIMSALIRHLLADTVDRGEPVAVLWAAEPEIYGRFGFGCASQQLSYTIPRGEGRLEAPTLATPAVLPGAVPPPAGGHGTGGPPRLRMADPDKHGELDAVYAPIAARRPGAVERDERWWQWATADPDWAREGAAPLRCVLAEDESGPRGYALYSPRPAWGDDGIPSGQVTVRELMATDIEAAFALWTDLLSRDLVSEVRVSARPVDDPLLHLLAGPRRARARLADGLWARLTDVPMAPRQRRYASDVDVVIEVTDTELAANAGRWRLQASAAGPASCERTAAAADVTATVQALGAAYLGGTRLGALAAAGQVVAGRPEALAALSTAMSWDPAPWCVVDF